MGATIVGLGFSVHLGASAGSAGLYCMLFQIVALLVCFVFLVDFFFYFLFFFTVLFKVLTLKAAQSNRVHWMHALDSFNCLDWVGEFKSLRNSEPLQAAQTANNQNLVSKNFSG
jgi:hypothetical protein